MPKVCRASRVLIAGIGLVVVCAVPFLAGHRQVAAVSISPTSQCPSTAGNGGAPSSQKIDTRGGDGCVVFVAGGVRYTFTYTGAIEQWTVPAGISSLTFHLLGAGGGASRVSVGRGGGGGYATGTMSVSVGQVFDVIVGEGGIRQCVVDVPPLSPSSGRNNATFGGGGSGNGAVGYNCSWASGGGRSAVRLSGGTDDLITAGGGGGAGYSGNGGAGGGTTGESGTACGGAGGTQSAGGATCSTSEPGTDGIKYAGGWAGYSASSASVASEGGGGGGGYYGGGAGGDNGGGGGGSSYVGSLTNTSTISGSGHINGMPTPAASSAPTINGTPEWGSTLTAISGTWSGTSTVSWQWQVSTNNVDWIDISGATQQTYVVGVSGHVRVVEIRTTPFTRVSEVSTNVSVPTTSTTSTTTTLAESTASVSPAVETTTPTQTTASVPPVTTTTVAQVVVPTTSPKNPFDVVDGAPRYLNLTVALSVGDAAEGAPLVSKSGGLKPGTDVVLEVHSEVQVIATHVADASGAVEFNSVLPGGLEPGLHLIVLRGVTPQGSDVSATSTFTLGADGKVLSFVPASESLSGIPTMSEASRSASVGVPLYDTTANVATTAGLAVAASVIGALMAATAVSGAAASKKSSDESAEGEQTERDTESQGEIGGIDADGMSSVDRAHSGRGDALRTWALPGHAHHQRVVEVVHASVSTKSSVLGRLVADGHWLRAVLGPIQAVLWVGSLILGVALGGGVQGVVAPAFTWVCVVAVLALFDAFAGTAVWIGFTTTVIARFGIAGVFDLRTLLGLGVLFMGIPLIANHARPLRRVVENKLDRVDRLADYAMLPILMAFASKSAYTALNGLSGLSLVSATNAKSFGWVVAVTLVGRMVAEDIVMRTHPLRMQESDVPATPGTPLLVDVATLLLKDALFLLAAGSFFGFGWRTWVVVALMTFVPMLKLFSNAFPNSPILHRWFPRGVLRTVVMLWVGSWLAILILGGDSSPEHTKAMTAVLLIPGIVIGIIDIIGREGGEWPNTLWKRFVGGCLWTFSFLVMFGIVAVG